MSATNSTPAAAPETTVYQQQLALYVLPNHTALALRYAARSRKLQPSLPPLTPISCPKCENICLHGRGSVRVVRKALLKQCHVCGTTTSVPRPSSLQAKGTFQSVRARKQSQTISTLDSPSLTIKGANPSRTADSIPPAPDQQPMPTSSVTSTQSQPLPIQPAPRTSTNKRRGSRGGLQSMLQRNREREMRETSEKNASSSGLTSFLQGL